MTKGNIGVIEFARDVMGIDLSEFQEEVLRQVERGGKTDTDEAGEDDDDRSSLG